MGENKTAIITAASRGMGRAIAEELYINDYQLVLMSSTDAILPVADNLNASALVGSVLNPQDLQAAVDLSVAKYGRIDAVVNNTGHPAGGDLLSLPDENWHTGMDRCY